MLRELFHEFTLEIYRRVNNDDNFRQNLSRIMQMEENTKMERCKEESAKMERCKEQVLEYRTILHCMKSLRKAEDMKHRSKHRVMKEKCQRYKEEIAEERVS